MASTAAPAPQQLCLPADLIGRLIGRGGATIQELETATACRIRIPRRDSAPAAGDKPQDLVSIAVRSVASRSAEHGEAQEARCARAAQLLCVEGLSVADALAQANAEQEAQKAAESAAMQEQHTHMAVRRVVLSWPEFRERDVRAALREACDDEDMAVDLLLGGFRAPCAVVAVIVPEQPAAAVEEYPSLLAGAPRRGDGAGKLQGFTLGASAGTRWSRARAGREGVTIGCEETFPGLPAPAPALRKTAGACRQLRAKKC